LSLEEMKALGLDYDDELPADEEYGEEEDADD
jgi:hypothetical protein